jgi:broad specificity phosphatase PhoE
MSAHRLYLARHGAMEGAGDERGGRYIGDTDHPLSADGIEQARRLGRYLASQHFSGIFCSDLLRGRQTAAIVAGDEDTPLFVRHDLREISMGAWDGLLRAEVARRFPGEYRARGENLEFHRVAGGESFADCRARILPALNEILSTVDGDVLVVGHAGVNRLVLCHVLGLPLANLFRLDQSPGCLNVIGQDRGRLHVMAMNVVP